MKLAGHKVLVTGGTRGFGFAFSSRARMAGAEVAIVARNAETVIQASERIGAHGIVGDVSQPEDHERVVAEAAERMGGISLLVNNAAVQHPVRFDRSFGEDAAQICAQEAATNLLGPMLLTGAVMPYLMDATEGGVVCISSILGFAPKQSAPSYCATKAGITTFARSLQFQWRTNPSLQSFLVILPLVDTDMTRGRGKRKVAPAKAADHVIREIERGNDMILVPPAQVFAWAHRLAPNVVGRIIRDE